MRNEIVSKGLTRLELFKWTATQSYLLKTDEMGRVKELQESNSFHPELERLMIDHHEVMECVWDDLTYSVIFKEEVNLDWIDTLLRKNDEIYSSHCVEKNRHLIGIEVIEHQLDVFKTNFIHLLELLECYEIIKDLMAKYAVITGIVDDHKEMLLSKIQ